MKKYCGGSHNLCKVIPMAVGVIVIVAAVVAFKLSLLERIFGNDD